MANVRFHTPENRLEKTLGDEDAPLVEQLITNANERLEVMGDMVRAHVRAALDDLLVYVGREDEALFADSEAIAAAALSIAEVAAVANMWAIGEIARGVTAMINDANARGAMRADALGLHLNALALIGQGDGAQTPENEVIVERLAALRNAIGIDE